MDQEAIRNHFDRRSAEYNKFTSWTKNQVLVEKVIDALELSPRARLIDVGCGTGVVLEHVLARHARLRQCVALDNSEKMLSKIQNADVTTCLGDAQAIPYGKGTFTHALARQSLHYMEDVAKAVKEVYRVLQFGGIFLVVQITPFRISDEKHWIRITSCRQPLRRNFLTLHTLVKILLGEGFVLSSVEQVKSKTTLGSWLSRYEATESQRKRLQTLFREAPAFYREIHAIEEIDDDIMYENCWTYIQAVKPQPLRKAS